MNASLANSSGLCEEGEEALFRNVVEASTGSTVSSDSNWTVLDTSNDPNHLHKDPLSACAQHSSEVSVEASSAFLAPQAGVIEDCVLERIASLQTDLDLDDDESFELSPEIYGCLHGGSIVTDQCVSPRVGHVTVASSGGPRLSYTCVTDMANAASCSRSSQDGYAVYLNNFGQPSLRDQ